MWVSEKVPDGTCNIARLTFLPYIYIYIRKKGKPKATVARQKGILRTFKYHDALPISGYIMNF